MKRHPLICIVLWLTACARAGAPGASTSDASELQTRRNLAVKAERVSASSTRIWQVLPSAFKDLGYQGKPSGTETLTFVTDPLRINGRLYDGELNSTYLDCGRTPAGGLAADEYSVTFAVFVRVVEIVSDASTIEARIDGVARTRNESSGRIRCWGTGKLEQRFIEAIKRRLAM